MVHKRDIMVLVGTDQQNISLTDLNIQGSSCHSDVIHINAANKQGVRKVIGVA